MKDEREILNQYLPANIDVQKLAKNRNVLMNQNQNSLPAKKG